MKTCKQCSESVLDLASKCNNCGSTEFEEKRIILPPDLKERVEEREKEKSPPVRKPVVADRFSEITIRDESSPTPLFTDIISNIRSKLKNSPTHPNTPIVIPVGQSNTDSPEILNAIKDIREDINTLDIKYEQLFEKLLGEIKNISTQTKTEYVTTDNNDEIPGLHPVLVDEEELRDLSFDNKKTQVILIIVLIILLIALYIFLGGINGNS